MNPPQSNNRVDMRECAHRQMQAGQWEAAETTLREILLQSPGDPAVCLALAEVLAHRGRWKDSSAPLVSATRHLPRHVPMVLELARQLHVRGEIVAARQSLDFVAQAPAPPFHLLKEQAGLRSFLKEYATAGLLLDRAMKVGADDRDTHFMRGMMAYFVGNLELAARELKVCIRRWPEYPDATVLMVNMQRQTEPGALLEHVDAQLHRLESGERSKGREFNRAQFEYARFKILDDLGRHEEAWPVLQRFNQRVHGLVPYEATETEALVDAIVHRRSQPTNDQRITTPKGPVPIFIVGMPRSGTTLLERMLSAHPRVASAGEIVEFRRQLRWMANIGPDQHSALLHAITRADEIDMRELGQRYLDQTQWRAGGKDFYVDKLPTNIEVVGLIHAALPHAPILHMTRDPMDVCCSLYKAMFGISAAYSYDFKTLAGYYRQYVRLVEHWHQHLPGAMLDVPYAELVSDPRTVMRKVLTHCGLAANEACLHPERNLSPVATRSAAQVREPINRHGVGRWRLYEKQLEPLRVALAAVGVDA